MLKKIFMAVAFFMLTLTFAAQNAHAEQVEVFTDSNTRITYYVEDSSITFTNSDVAFKVKVIAYVVGEGGMARTVKRADEPAYSVFKFCIKHLHGAGQPLAGA